MRPWFVGTLLNPPPDVCGLVLLAYDPATLPCCCDEPGRTDPATPKPFPCCNEPPFCVLKTPLYASGRAKPEPSCNVTTRIPGRGCAGGWVAIASEAAVMVSCIHSWRASHIPMPLSLGLLAMLAFSSLAESAGRVDADGEREKVLASGPRCVSLSSASFSQYLQPHSPFKNDLSIMNPPKQPTAGLGHHSAGKQDSTNVLLVRNRDMMMLQ